MEIISKDKIYTYKEVKNIILNSLSKQISDVAIYKRINKLLTSSVLSQVGRGLYIFNCMKTYTYSLSDSTTLKLINEIECNFGKNAKFIIYKTSILNEFLNHQIGRPTIIVEAEKDIKDSIYWMLKENGYQYVLLNPSENENYLYNPYNENGIIVKTMVSKAPINNKEHKITIEKLVVDIIADKTINMFYENSEIPKIMEEIFNNYSVKIDSVKNYAKRRHCLEKLVKYLPNYAKGDYYDQTRNI